MVRLQDGDSLAFDELVDRHQSNLMGFFIRNLRDRQVAEDLTQETLLRLHQRFWDYIPVGRFGGWLYRIARNLMIDHVRKRSHDALVRSVTRRDDDEQDVLARIAGDLTPPDQLVDQREFAEIVEQLLHEIPEEQRATFLMHHYSGLSLPDVADAMQTNTATAKSRLRLAREKLQERLLRHGITAETE